METSVKPNKTVFDFRMDKISWVMLALMVGLFAFLILPQQFGIASDSIAIWKYMVYGILMSLILVAISCIPIVIVCLFINRIPDIDYAIWFATAVTIFSSVAIFI